ncbi:MAG: hypothetical protein K2J08_13510 [Ruminococcus sp.]|nr:hypothetical protein [Ruminococcus sp.]
MDFNEIERYIRVGSGFIEVARDFFPEYSGICRRTFIRNDSIQIDFTTLGNIELNEGETTFYFTYDNLENAVKSAEKFLKKPVAEWKNYNRTWNEWNFSELNELSFTNLLHDLKERRLEFPEDFNRMRICNVFWVGVFLGKINPEDDFLKIAEDVNFSKYLMSLDNEFDKYKEVI